MQTLMRRLRTFMGAGASSAARGEKSTSHSCGVLMEPTAAMGRQEPFCYFIYYFPALPHVHVQCLCAICLVEDMEFLHSCGQCHLETSECL